MAPPTTPQLLLADLERLATTGSADLPEALIRFLAQPDPPTGTLKKGAVDAAGLASSLRTAYGAQGDERRVKVALAWQRYLSQTEPPPAPRFFLAGFLTSLYESGDEAARSSLVDIILAAPLRLGLWGGLKRIYKRSEARHDALIFGALAARFDVEQSGPDVSRGTLVYLRRRAWRYLRHLGVAVPHAYPQFAVATLACYPEKANLAASWVAAHIIAHHAGTFDGTSHLGPLKELVKHRAFDEAWKASADPLMVLLETCRNDTVARFAIQSLRRDFPEVLRAVDAPWLARLARRPLESIHEFVVDTLSAAPQFHAAALKGLGLHDTVLSLLLSRSQRARTYAVEYARVHAGELPVERLVELASSGLAETVAFALSTLQRLPPRAIGHRLFGVLLTGPHAAWAQKVLAESFDRSELPLPWLTELLFGPPAQAQWAQKHLTTAYKPEELGAEFWKGVLDDPRAKLAQVNTLRPIFTQLLTFPPEAIGGAWALQTFLYEPWRALVDGWLKKVERLPGVDVERLKGCVFDPRLRPTALALLERPQVASFSQLTLQWLLALARRADQTLNQWATRYLLARVTPVEAGGAERLLELATGAREPDQVRAFAQSYLLVHHPLIGKDQPQAQSYQITPQLTLEAYPPEPLFKALFDARPDVRRFAVTLARASLRRWGWLERVYLLADSEHKEVRNVAFDALLKAGQPGAEPQSTFAIEELDPEKVFAMTDSRMRQSREVAMEVIARHYERLGGPERLAWLMASADRTVRQMAVRLLWERHRPRGIPRDWKPRSTESRFIAEGARFTSVEALRGFLRVLLYGLPPGRAAEPAEGKDQVRKVSAGVAKQRAIEASRDLAVEDPAFARVISPLLVEMTGSVAKGEWESCVSALASLRAAHPSIDLGIA